ncbi:peptidylprolyl isomerase [Panacibacter sp. DH6]|uniref:Peptidylprolyl isomerase n=1 Tax=Panacibacter microcysteis TaxID=2793269 RepID=A0A931GXK9_9BACT|nr:peptidylprolyl isomerase [Panacibacter microcysteis]MBG9375989.1 peptidylprolyl isomerase [Panacibacter microcysteis]
MKKYSLLLLVAFVFANNSFAQKVVADKIIAQIGDKIVLRSDLTNAIADYKRQGMEEQLPPNAECAFLQGQLIQKTLVIQAEKDSLFVEDDELEALLDNRIRYFISQYGSQDMLEQIAGRTVYEIKEDLRQPFKEKTMAEKMQGKILENVKITPNEVKDYFDKIPKDSLLFYESELEVNQLVVYPKPNKDLEEYVSAQLLDYKRQVESGQKKFDQLAKMYTDDPGSKETGGQYSINRLDKSWDPTFVAAAFKLKEGQISPVIKSKFGLHIIQMVSRAGDDAVVRHILKIPPVTDAEVKIAITKLDSIRNEITKGNITFAAAVTKLSDDENSKFNNGALLANDGSPFLTIDKLDKDAVVALKGLKPGDISRPQSYTDERQRKAVRILFLKSRTEPHRENMKDDYNRISQRALELKKQTVLEKWFKEHIPNYYVTVDKEYTGCASISDWLNVASASR